MQIVSVHQAKTHLSRLLEAQAIAERLVCVTRDPAFTAYGVPVLW